MCHVGSASSDVCYLLYSSTTSLFRRMHENEVLEAYFSTLMDTLRSLGVIDADFDPTFDQFREEVKQVRN